MKSAFDKPDSFCHYVIKIAFFVLPEITFNSWVVQKLTVHLARLPSDAGTKAL